MNIENSQTRFNASTSTASSGAQTHETRDSKGAHSAPKNEEISSSMIEDNFFPQNGLKANLEIEDAYTPDDIKARANSVTYRDGDRFFELSRFVDETTEPVVTEFNLIEPEKQRGNDNPNTITIIHTNDLHGNLDPNNGKGGVSLVASKVKELREHDRDNILVDAGDIAYNPPYSDRHRFDPMVEIMNTMNYDAQGAGNHEFQYEARSHGGPEGNPDHNRTDNLKELSQNLKAPLICANVIRKDLKERPDYIKPYVIKKVGNVNVGITEVVTKKMATEAHPDVADGWQVLDQSEALNKIIPEMKEKGADIVVVLSHDNLNKNKNHISQTRGADIWIGAHDHISTEAPMIVRSADGKNVPLVEAGAYGYMVGELKVEIDPSTKKPTKITSILHPVNSSTTKPDSEVEKVVQKWQNK